MQLYSIASGSCGNCIYVGTDETGILIDVGISMKKVREGLALEGLSLEAIRAILITHEHTDHISGLGPILRKVPIPVYATGETISAIWKKGNMNRIEENWFHEIVPGQEFSIEEFRVMPISISHDAANPVCYTLKARGKKVGIATDIGTYTVSMLNCLKQCDSLLVEANHDINLLQVGTYPYDLKRRILGERGHLSNDACARFIQELLHPGLQHVILGHLSQENNFPELAYNTVSYELEKNDVWNSLGTELLVAHRTEPTRMITIK